MTIVIGLCTLSGLNVRFGVQSVGPSIVKCSELVKSVVQFTLVSKSVVLYKDVCLNVTQFNNLYRCLLYNQYNTVPSEVVSAHPVCMHSKQKLNKILSLQQVKKKCLKHFRPINKNIHSVKGVLIVRILID